ncbi:TonB-dependent receptor [Saccharobesus litoralis]|uniref:TonB-dependent receptor n=1 Tax=Saccharobesus litoralis TaxID=2172099 RepID=A0A2S0VNL8_9ALTE|nr:TonB-dependent receptor [Saccharobesus litoralis]AWB65789.1 TonB-dependent receptor [Saccharobesus litoralis]
MSNTRERFKLSALSLAILASSASMMAYANEKEEDDDTEVIEVTGFKGSLIKSINDKKYASGVIDTINAEDIGKNTDQNIADALGRVTGVSVVSRDGEGTQITVRGASANQNNISLNGQQLSSTDFNQAVDLSSFSADILSKLEVVKTPSADHDEGSLGANVNLVTTRPLDLSNEVLSATLQGRYSDFSEEANYKLQLSGTKKFLDETLGVAATVYSETNAYRKDQMITGIWETSDVIRVARDQNGDIISNFKVMQPNAINYRLNQNTSDRQGGSLGIQFLPTDVSELMLNLTYSKQTQERTFDSIRSRFPPGDNFVEGELVTNVTDDFGNPVYAPFTDPQEDWYTVDTDTYTFTKRIDRYGAGDISRSDGGTENENFNATLSFKTELTDTLRMEALVGMSESTSESLPNLYANLQNFKQTNKALQYLAGADIQPVGYDCTSGKCVMIAGTHDIILGQNIGDTKDDDGNLVEGWRDNISLTGFNPSDDNSFHMGSISQADRQVEDTIQNAQIDFDFDLDAFGITTVEFGAKFTSRSKFVDDQSYQFASITKSDSPRGEDGRLLGQPAGPINEILARDILAEGGQKYDDFMESLDLAQPGVTDDITTIDVWKAFHLAMDDDRVARNADDSETRSVEMDTGSLYLKANFSLLDDRLTGDLGVRYVKTEVESSGFSGGQFHDFPQHADETEFDWKTLSQLRDTSLPACPQPTYANPDSPTQIEQKLSRIDGRGWNTNGSNNPADWTRIPMFDQNGDGVQDACHDPNYAAWAESQANGTPFVAVVPGWGDTVNPGWNTMWRYADVQVTNDHNWTTDPNAVATDFYEWNQGTDGHMGNYKSLQSRDASRVAFATQGSHEYTNVLPSLNLNYAFSDEFVGRFAVSKTMTRPEFEDIRPGFNFNTMWKTYWGGGARSNIGKGVLNMFNAQLEPLESKNLDLSLEWYFNDVSMLSLALFRKDMSNFVDNETLISYITDLRNVQGSFDASGLLLPVDESAPNFGLEGCTPVRTTTDLGWISGDPLSISNDFRDICHEFDIVKKINGKGATIEGLELGYSQVYDFLPGFLSGLGLSANYTYQKSETEAQESSLVEGKFLTPMPVAETPKHSYNATLFWEQHGHQVRLSYRGSSDSLVGIDWDDPNLSRGANWYGGSIWNEGRDTLDLSANYQINENVSVNFQAINITNEQYRRYYTNRELKVLPVLNDTGSGYTYVPLEEGNPLEGEAPTSRTYDRYKVGATYRIGVRVNF